MQGNPLKVSVKSHVHKNGLHINNTWALQKQVPILFQQSDKFKVKLKMVIMVS